MSYNVITCHNNYITKLCYLLVFLEVPYKADLEPGSCVFVKGAMQTLVLNGGHV